MLRPVVTKVAPPLAAEKDAAVAEQSGAVDLALRCPTRRSVCRDVARLTGAPERAGDGGRAAEKSARPGDHPRLVENLGRIGFVVIPPRKYRPRPIYWRVEQDEPRSEEQKSELQS